MSINNVIANNFAPAPYLAYITSRFGLEVTNNKTSDMAKHYINDYSRRLEIPAVEAVNHIRKAFNRLPAGHLAHHADEVEEALTLIAEGYPVTLRDVIRTSPSSLTQLIKCLEDSAPAPKNPRKVKKGFRLLRELIEAAQ